MGGAQKAVLYCTTKGHVFAGEKYPSPQYCNGGYWSYEVDNYDIPGCQGKDGYYFVIFI